MSKIMDYLVKGGDGLAMVEAQLEHALGHLESALEDERKKDAEIVRLRAVGKAIIAANDEFRATMPPDWESDPINDACEAARALFSDNEQFAQEE